MEEWYSPGSPGRWWEWNAEGAWEVQRAVLDSPANFPSTEAVSG